MGFSVSIYLVLVSTNNLKVGGEKCRGKSGQNISTHAQIHTGTAEEKLAAAPAELFCSGGPRSETQFHFQATEHPRSDGKIGTNDPTPTSACCIDLTHPADQFDPHIEEELNDAGRDRRIGRAGRDDFLQHLLMTDD